MTVADLIDYLLVRESTHDLALQLAYVRDVRRIEQRPGGEVTCSGRSAQRNAPTKTRTNAPGSPRPARAPFPWSTTRSGSLPGRQLLPRDEALGLLRRVGSEVHDPVRAASVERIVADTDSGSAEQMMVSCTDLVDPLLDIRLVLCS